MEEIGRARSRGHIAPETSRMRVNDEKAGTGRRLGCECQSAAEVLGREPKTIAGPSNPARLLGNDFAKVERPPGRPCSSIDEPQKPLLRTERIPCIVEEGPKDQRMDPVRNRELQRLQALRIRRSIQDTTPKMSDGAFSLGPSPSSPLQVQL